MKSSIRTLTPALSLGALFILGAAPAIAVPTASFSSPAPNTTVTQGTDVNIAFSVSGFNFGINTITVSGERDPWGSNTYGPFPVSPPTNSYNNIAIYTIPSDATPGEVLTVTLTATGYADDTVVRTLDLVAGGTVVPPPANNDFASATTISGNSGTVSGTNVGATKESGEPNHSGNSGGKSVWWKWTPALNGQAAINTTGSNFDTIMGVYVGSAVSSLTMIAANDDNGSTGGPSGVSFSASGGVTYYIAVDGYLADSGNITLNWLHTPVAAANDWALYE